MPEIKPFVLLNLPSETEISYHKEGNNNFVKGSAVEFCQVVTQVRNIGDTDLNILGEETILERINELNEHLKNSKEPLFQSSLKAKISIDRTLKEVVEDGWEEDEDYIMWPN